MLAVDGSQTFIKSKVIAATEELSRWQNRLFLSCRVEILCPHPVRPPGSSDRSLGVLTFCKSTFPVLQPLKYRAATSPAELTAGSTRSRQCNRHLGAVTQEASSSVWDLEEKKVLNQYFGIQYRHLHDTRTVKCLYI